MTVSLSVSGGFTNNTGSHGLPLYGSISQNKELYKGFKWHQCEFLLFSQAFRRTGGYTHWYAVILTSIQGMCRICVDVTECTHSLDDCSFTAIQFLLHFPFVSVILKKLKYECVSYEHYHSDSVVLWFKFSYLLFF